jgi:antitoxin VapB
MAKFASVYTRVYISGVTRAKLFHNGGSQAVRLPKSYRFPDDQNEVMVRREGHRIILEPIDEWPPAFVGCLGAWSEEIERPASERVSRLKDPFR